MKEKFQDLETHFAIVRNSRTECHCMCPLPMCFMTCWFRSQKIEALSLPTPLVRTDALNYTHNISEPQFSG